MALYSLIFSEDETSPGVGWWQSEPAGTENGTLMAAGGGLCGRKAKQNSRQGYGEQGDSPELPLGLLRGICALRG